MIQTTFKDINLINLKELVEKIQNIDPPRNSIKFLINNLSLKSKVVPLGEIMNKAIKI